MVNFLSLAAMIREFSICAMFAWLLTGHFSTSVRGQDPVGPAAGTIIMPVDIPVFLSGNFGEPRANHFHSGIDIKTNGTTGVPVLSVCDGYVSRIKVEPGGYGKALYIVHPNGFTSVYAHLSAFNDDVDRFVKSEQYRIESFGVDLFPSGRQFPVRQGQVVAFSGNSGSSEGPHLHFELRETHSENPVNPLVSSLLIKDHIPPVVERLYVFSQAGNKYWNKPVVVALQGGKGSYCPVENAVVPLDHSVGIGLAVYDLLDGSANRCGIYRIRAYLGEDLFFETVIDEFSFAETRYMNSFMDYRLFMGSRRPVVKLFIDPNNRASVYRYARNNGIVSSPDNHERSLKILIEDAAGNLSTVACRTRLNPLKFQKDPGFIPTYDAFFNYAESNRFEDKGIQLALPQGALYDNLYFRYEQKPALFGCYSKLHLVHRSDVPLHQYYRLALAPENLPESVKSKAIIAQVLENGNYSPVGGTWEGNWLVTRTRNFGAFCIRIDTVPPEIKPANFTSASELKTIKSIRFMIRDSFSGIQKFRGEIDGQWVLFDYDPKNNLIEHTFDPDRMLAENPHKLVITATDQRNNTRKYNITFIR